MGKKPKFFCDFCGNEVKQNDISCKRCGKFFSAVRCPQCGKTGTADIFANGCPICGYAFKPGEQNAAAAKKGERHYVQLPGKKTEVTSDPLPVWIYVATLGAAVLIVAAILFLGMHRR